jgi:hypothetical protein
VALVPPARTLASILAALVALSAWVATAGALAPVPGCSSFASQADAQDHFARFGGSPGNTVGALDSDRDGVACEGRPGPYKAFATIGYHRKGGFFYGVATMPPAVDGDDRFPCLYGNRHYPDGPRLLNVYKVQPGADKPILGAIGAEARPESGRLLWKAEREAVTPGRYYAAFEDKVRMQPYGPNECPGFHSAEIALP